MENSGRGVNFLQNKKNVVTLHPNKKIINSIITTEKAENPMKSRR